MKADLLQNLGKTKTLLCVGPMSRNCVDVTVELANEFQVPIMLIASRRQVESAAMGGGYVENWNTREFVQYVRARDTGGYVIVARDHGGPYQHPKEAKMNLEEAMASAKASFTADIESGMDFIHIDPSIDPHAEPDAETLLNRCFELLEHCTQVSRQADRPICFEFGTEEQVPYVKSVDDFGRLLRHIGGECARRQLPKPMFVVGQTGTKVMEMRNVGTFAPGAEATTHARLLVAVLNGHGMLLKVHNGDYLNQETLALHLELGIGGLNIAPEYGVLESKTFLDLLESKGQANLAARFLQLALNSGKWEKWMLGDTQATDRERALIAGHYVFAKPEFHQIRREASESLKMPLKEIDIILQKALRALLVDQLQSLGYAIDTTTKKDSSMKNVTPISEHEVGGHILRKFNLASTGRHAFADEPYFYFHQMIAAHDAIEIAADSVVTIYILDAGDGATLQTVDRTETLRTNQVLQIEGLAAKLSAGNSPFNFFVAGVYKTKTPPPSSKS